MITFAAASRQTARRIEMIMGMPISLALRGRHCDDGRAGGAWSGVVAQLREVDQVFSTYREDSYVSRLGRGDIELTDCPAEVAEVLAIGDEAARRSDGAFSIMLPSPDGPRLDPSGAVKGWAVERAARILRELDDTDFCLSAGGDMVCHTGTSGSPAWRIGIESPHDPRRLIGVVPVTEGAVATSGAAHRGEHIVDARTGKPPTGITSVTVIADSLTRADIDATSAYAHGSEAVDWLSRQPDLLALAVMADRSCVTVNNRGATRR
jgi:thiamine biosynthesis lipoprotein